MLQCSIECDRFTVDALDNVCFGFMHGISSRSHHDGVSSAPVSRVFSADLPGTWIDGAVEHQPTGARLTMQRDNTTTHGSDRLGPHTHD